VIGGFGLLQTAIARAAVIAATFFLLGFAWLVSNPPGAAPDEDSHYVRMVGLSYGHLIGHDVPVSRDAGIVQARVDTESGAYDLPGTAPPPIQCHIFRAERPYDCAAPPAVAGTIRAISYHARTLPLAYGLPALLSRLAASTFGKLYLGRLGFLIQNTALVFLTLIAVPGSPAVRRPDVVAALYLAFTPLAAFLMGQLATSGTEITAYVAFVACLLRVLSTPTSRWWWATVAMGSVALWTRDLGVLMVPTLTVLVLVSQISATRRLARLLPRSAIALGLAAWAVIWGGALLWHEWLQYPVQLPTVPLSALRAVVADLRETAHGSVGRVGWLEVNLNVTLVRLWLGAAILVGLYLAATNRRWAAVTAVCVAFWIGVNIWLTLHLTAAGFGNQARYTLAIPMTMILIAAECARLRPFRSKWPEAVVYLTAVVTAVGHFSMLLLNARRHAHGLGDTPISFSHAVWSPPIGWPATLALCAVACAAVAALPLLRAIPRRATPAQ
jgi:hypothetical protein